jgi:hypothetical protein
MALSAFDNKTRAPNWEELQRVLGRSSTAWQTLTEWLAERFQPLGEEWVFASKKWGWSLRLKQKKRAILYLTPCEKHFLVGLVLGEKAVAAALKMKLPAGLPRQIKTAERFAEGRAIRLEIRYKKDLEGVRLLADAKMSN